jgi:GMP synthase-like glutamine amidotransferase
MIALAPAHKNQLSNYTSWLEKRGLSYRILKSGETLEKFQMLILCGGPDVGGAPDRDQDEFRWLEEAYGKIPVLGICRGMQITNVFLGGTLHEDLNEDIVFHTSDKKTIAGEPQPVLESRWHNVTLCDKVIKVNSRHHQGVKDLAPGVKVLATCEDGLVEMMEGKKSLFVQWHPERPEVWETEAESIVFEWIKANYKHKQKTAVELILDYMEKKGFSVISDDRARKLVSGIDISNMIAENTSLFKRVADRNGRPAIKKLKS